MAKKWAEVAASPEFNALEPQQQEEARQQYWREVVAPNVPQEQLQAVQSEFDADTKPTIANPDAKPLDVEITGGQSVPAADYAQMRKQEGAQVPAAKPAPQPEGNAVGRALGQVGGRQVLQGAYGLYGALGGDLLDHYVLGPIDRTLGTEGTAFQIGTGGRGYRQAASELADRLGMYRPQTAKERIISDVGEALTGTGLTMGLGSLLSGGATAAPSAASKLGDLLSGQPVRQVIGTVGGATGSSVARESGADENTQMLAGLAGGLGPDLLGTGGAAAVRGLVRGRNGDAMNQTIRDFASVGATPSVGQASGNRAIQGIESLLAGAPTSTGVMSRFAENQAQDIGSGLGRMANNLSRNASGERAGRAVINGVTGEGGFIPSSRNQADQLYSNLDQLIPQDSRVSVENARQALAYLNAEIPGAPSLSQFFKNARLQGIEGALSQDTNGLESALSRPGVKAQADALRDQLEERASAQRANLAQQSNSRVQEELAIVGAQRDAEIQKVGAERARALDALENRRSQLYQQYDEMERSLLEGREAAIARNAERESLGMNNFEEVPSLESIKSQIPTRKQIDSHLPSRAEVEAQFETPEQIASRYPSNDAIFSKDIPAAAWGDQTFGRDYIDKQVNKFLSKYADGKLPYEALQKLRTLVGSEIENASLLSDVPRSKWKSVYGALSKDMEAAATTPEEKFALARANSYFNARVKRIDELDRVIDKNGSPEAVYNAVMQGSRDGGTTLRAVMQSLPQDGQKAVTAAVIKRMGMATPGAQDAAGDVFSAATFMTNWNRVSPEAKRALFDRYGPSFSKSMDQIARVADNIKQGSRVYANPSGTANRAAAYTYGASLVASMFDPTLISTGGLIGGGLAANGAARYLTDPRAVRWLAKATEMPRHALVVNARMLAQSANKAGDENMMQLAQDVENAIGNSGPAEDNGRNK